MLVALAAAAAAQEAPTLEGTLRDHGDEQPIAAVLVEALGTHRHAWSDSLGEYELSLVETGPQRIRFSRLGYEGLEVEVVLPSEGELRLDASLRARPIAMSGVRLDSPRASGLPLVSVPHQGPMPELGATTFAPGDRRLAAPSGEPDVLAAAAGTPGVVVRPDLPTALHVRGGSADQNLVLLDGIPIPSPYHSGGVLSALPPDAVADATLHAGVPPAALGGALSSTIEVRTLDVPRSGFSSRGGVGVRGLRAVASQPLPGGGGGLLLAGRRSYRPGFPGGDDNPGGGFNDVLAKATLDLGDGGIDALGFASNDDVGFVANPEVEGEPAGGELAVLPPGEGFNRFRWNSRAAGLTWRDGDAGALRREVRAWGSGFDATLDWAAESAPVRLSSVRSQLGLEARMAGPLAGGSASGGVSFERLDLHYDVENLTPPVEPLADSLLALESSTEIVSAFFEEVWSVGPRWALRVGLRGQVDPGRYVLPEPRLQVSFAPSAGVHLSAGYARTRQAVQSLRNEESILDAVAGIELPAAAGTRDLPVARSDQLTAGLSAEVVPGTRLTLDAYLRWLDGLVLVAPTTAQPFALWELETGSGRASGAALLVEHRSRRLAAQAAFSLGSATRHGDGVSYHTSFERSRSLSAAVDWRVRGATSVTAGLLAETGGPTSLVAGSFTWEPLEPLGGDGEVEGSPQHILGALNAARLPGYLRLDVGLRHEWAAAWLREGAGLSVQLDVLNVLDRRNAVGYALDPGTEVRRPLSLLGRSLVVGLEWRY